MDLTEFRGDRSERQKSCQWFQRLNHAPILSTTIFVQNTHHSSNPKQAPHLFPSETAGGKSSDPTTFVGGIQLALNFHISISFNDRKLFIPCSSKEALRAENSIWQSIQCTI